MSGNIQKYGEFTLEQADRELEESERSGASADFFKPPAGQSTVRFLPPKIGRSTPFRIVHQHFINIPGASSPISFVCPRMQAKIDRLPARFCPACAKADELREKGHPSAYELAGEYLPRRRIFACVVFRGDPERGPLVFPFGKQIHEQLLSLRKNDDAGGNFCDPSDIGFDIVIDKTGSGLKTEYKVFAARKLSPLADPETAAIWIETMPDLDRYARIPSDAEIQQLMGGGRPGAGGGGGPRGPHRRTAADAVEDES